MFVIPTIWLLMYFWLYIVVISPCLVCFTIVPWSVFHHDFVKFTSDAEKI